METIAYLIGLLPSPWDAIAVWSIPPVLSFFITFVLVGVIEGKRGS